MTVGVLRIRPVRAWTTMLLLGLLVADSAVLLASRSYIETKQKVALPNRSVTLTCAKPADGRPAAFLVLFASGDGGLHFTSKTVYKYLADRGYYVAAFSSGQALQATKSSGKGMTVAEFSQDITILMREGKRILGLPDATATVLTGLSRGASMVVLAGAQSALQSGLAGGVAIALTRESDYGKAPESPGGSPEYQLDEKGRILIYPLLDRFGLVPLAVVQSTRDSYVPSEESRKLMGPDTALRRLYEIEARNHSFWGAKDKMLRQVDAALQWIVSIGRRR